MIVYADMVADLFHRGHLEFIRKIRRMYPDCRLVIGVHSDEVVSRYKRIPIFSHNDRVEIVKSIKGVDAVMPDAPLVITKEFIDSNNIDVVVHGSDMEGFEASYRVPTQMGIMRIVSYYRGISTSEVIDKCRQE